MSDKEAAVRTIRELPMMRPGMTFWRHCWRCRARRDETDRPEVLPPDASVKEAQDVANAQVGDHLERRGWATVLSQSRGPPITVDMVNELIQEMRREREDRWLGVMDKGGEYAHLRAGYQLHGGKAGVTHEYRARGGGSRPTSHRG